MIPYDDLVGALANWRARQGLPVDPSAVPVRTAPQPGRQAAVVVPESVEVDDAALLEEGYDPESDFGNLFTDGSGGEATSVGAAPRPEGGFESSTPPPRGRGW